MKKPIDLPSASILSPAEMNKIHFGGNLTPLTPEQIETIAHSSNQKPEQTDNSEATS